jgi:YVTN family beta-propeller protein
MTAALKTQKSASFLQKGRIFFLERKKQRTFNNYGYSRAAGLALALAVLPAFPSAAAQTTALGAPDGWKYLAFDPATKSVFVAHGNEITVVDSASMRIIGHVPGMAGAHGVAIVPGGHGYAASSKSATVSVFDPKTFKVIAVLKAGEDANSVTYDAASHHVFVANDDAGTITVIDATTDAAVASIPLAGGEGLESAAADGMGHVFVNHGAQNDIVRIDTRKSLVDSTWPLPGCTKPQGLALDVASRRVFVSCDNGRLLVLDAHDGRLIASVPIGPDSDSVLLDARRRRIYTANADGTLSVIAIESPDRYVPQTAIATAKGAHTAALDPATGVVYLVTADIAAKAPLRPHYIFKPGTVKLLAIDPASVSK